MQTQRRSGSPKGGYKSKRATIIWILKILTNLLYIGLQENDLYYFKTHFNSDLC